MSEWQSKKLGDFIRVKHGYAFKGKNITDEETDAILVTPGNFKIGGGFKSSKFKYFNSDYPEDYVLSEGDIVVTMTDLSKESDTLGYSAKIPSIKGKVFLHNQRIGLVEFTDNEVSKEFLYWLMRTSEYQWYCVSSASGTSIMHTSPSRIEDYDFKLPTPHEQRAIASVLSSLDDKIDLLHRQNQTLEQMAETLFRQWFVENFDNANYVKLGQLVDTVDNRGKTPKWSEEKSEFPLIEVNALGNRLVDYSKIKKYVDEETYATWFRAHPKKYDTLVSTVGSIGEFSMFLLERGSIAQNVVAFQAKEISPFYLYQTLNFFKRDIKEFDIGSVQPSIKVSHLREYEIPVFNDSDYLKKFDSVSKDISSKLEFNYLQIERLNALKTALLPKLMSGDIRLSENG